MDDDSDNDSSVLPSDDFDIFQHDDELIEREQGYDNDYSNSESSNSNSDKNENENDDVNLFFEANTLQQEPHSNNKVRVSLLNKWKELAEFKKLILP